MAAAAATAESPTNTDSPRSPKPALPRSTPWAQLVRGATESAEAPVPDKIDSSPPLTPEKCNVAKKPAWNKPVEGVSVPNKVSGGSNNGGGGGVVVIGGPASWPALSDSARLSQKAAASLASTAAPASPKSSPEDSQVPATSNTQQAKRGNASANQNSNNNNSAPVRQRSMKQGGGGNRHGGCVMEPAPPTPFPVFWAPNAPHSRFAGVHIMGPDFSLPEVRPAGGFGSQPSPSSENSNHRSSNRRGVFGHRGLGNGRNNYHGARRELDQGNHEWNSSQNKLRGGHRHPQGPGRSFAGPPVQGPTSFAPPPHLVPYGPVIGYPGMQYMYIYPVPLEAGGMTPYFAPAPPPSYLVDSVLREKVVRQIDYYFSDDNLAKDEYLKSKMNEEGWVSIGLIANFPRVQSLNVSTSNILDFLGASEVVEVEGDKIRRRGDWSKWVFINRSSAGSGLESLAAPRYNLVNSVQKVSLDDVEQDSMTVPVLKLEEMNSEPPGH